MPIDTDALTIPATIDDVLSRLGRQRGLAPPEAAQLTSIVRSIMRAYSGPVVEAAHLVKALQKIGRLSGGGTGGALADLATLARLLESALAGGEVRAPQSPPLVEPRREPPMPPAIPRARVAGRRGVTLDVMAEHLDEAAFCFVRWEVAGVAPHYTPIEVEQGPEERLRAHLDGLVLGGRPVAEKLLLPALAHDEAAVRFAAVWCLAASEDGDFGDEIVTALSTADDAGRAAMARALALSRSEEIPGRLSKALADLSPAVRREAARLLVGRLPAAGEAGRWLAVDDPVLVAGALAGLRGDLTGLVEALDHHLRSADEAVRRAAMRAGLVAGVPAAWGECIDAATGACASADGLIALAILGGAAEHAAVERALQDPRARRAALFALGFSGRRRAAELCLEVIGDGGTDATTARVAGEAFGAITGLVVAGRYARREWDDDDETANAYANADAAVDSASDLDDIEPTLAEAALPLPNEPELRAWWSSAESRFARDQRYLGGAPVGAQGLMGAVAAGPMRRRAGHAFELAVRTRGALFVDTADWVAAQRAALARTPPPRLAAFSAVFSTNEGASYSRPV